AFKAIGSNGLSVDVTGNVVDSLGEELFQIKTEHKGMGKIALQAQAGQVYYANVKIAGGLEKRFKIGQASRSGVLLQLKHNQGKIIYEVINKTNIDDQSLCILIHSRGKLMAVKQLNTLSKLGHISESSLPAGIVAFSVINQLTGETLSERLSFVLPSKAYSIRMDTDKPIYNRREKVLLNFNLLGKDSIPVKGDFSLSITDSHSVIQSPMADNIISSLLLTSDLKGYIEDPGSYFMDANKATQENLDLLMLTQGWRRFNTSAVVNGKIKKPAYYLEIGQTLSGKVTNFFNKPAKNIDIIALSFGNTFFMKKSTTDSLGQYLMDVSFQDSTIFMVKASKKKNRITDVSIIPDPDDFPEASTFIPTTEKNQVSDQTDYFAQSKEKYYNDGGIRVINLKEVSVEAKKQEASSSNEYYSGLADNSIGLDALDQMQSRFILQILMTIPGVVVNGENISIRGSSGQPLIMIDNMEANDINDI
ncbi:MAG: Plug domain-containing protein, partial [Bacteroidales bacterium]|nr:Plug domain-containing protein [Bacteroidales bacterium]